MPRLHRDFLAAGALVSWIVACGPVPAQPTAAPAATAAATAVTPAAAPSPAAATSSVAPSPVTAPAVVAPTQSLVPASPVAGSTPRLDLLLRIGYVAGVPTGPSYNGLAVDQQGNIYLGEDIPGGRVHVFDPQGKPLATWGEGTGNGEGQFDYITALAVDDQGNVYVADFNNVRIQKFDRSGKFLAQWPTEQPAGPVGLALDSADNVYVVNHRVHTHYVQKFDSAGRLLLAWGSTGMGPGEIGAGPHSGPEGLMTNAAGHVYVGDVDNSRVQEFTADGGFLSTFGSVGFGEGKFFHGPLGVAVDGSGNIFTTEEVGTIQEFDPSGRFLRKWDQTGVDRLIALDHQGNIYVIGDSHYSLLKYRKP